MQKKIKLNVQKYKLKSVKEIKKGQMYKCTKIQKYKRKQKQKNKNTKVKK